MDELKCTKCGVVQPIGQFYKNKSAKLGYNTNCKKCYRAYYLANRERILAASKAKRVADPEAALEYGRRYYQANKEKLKAYFRQYAKDNPEKMSAACKRYRKKNPDRAAAQDANIKRRYYNRVNGIEMPPCILCGSKASDWHHPSYEDVDNVVPLCTECHRLAHEVRK